jgi:hypothetical protein
MASLTKVDICNMALDLIDERAIVTLGDPESRSSLWMARNYGIALNRLLAAHDWNFARTRACLPAHVAKPEFDWNHAYELPPDCVRVMPLRADGRFGGITIPYVVEGRRILTDVAAPLRLSYVSNTVPEGSFPAHFADALATHLAFRATHFITGKASLFERLAKLHARTLEEAQRIDALQGTAERAYSQDIIGIRHL